MTLQDMTAPCRFRAVNLDKTGTLLRVGTGSAIVRWDGTRHKRFFDKRAEQWVEFDEPTEKPGPVCLGLEVEALDQPSPTERKPGAKPRRGAQGQLALPLTRPPGESRKSRAGVRRKPRKGVRRAR